MGFFDALFRYGFGIKKQTNVEVWPEKVFMTTDDKFDGVAGYVSVMCTEPEKTFESETDAILLVAHFPDVLTRFEEIASQQAWDVPCKAVLARNLNTDLFASLNLDESAVIDVIVGERHPLRSVDERLEEFAHELPFRCRISHHVSLEDAVMKGVANDLEVKKLLKQIGLEEGESISSIKLSHHIRQEQQKIESRAFGTDDAESALEWLEKNYS